MLPMICASGCGSANDDHAASAAKRLAAENRKVDQRIRERMKRLQRKVAEAKAQQAQAARNGTVARGADVANGAEVAVASRTSVPKPAVVPRFIPFPEKRKQEMAAYAQRHYSISDYHLRSPKVIVEHYTVSADAQSAINTFAPDVADSELHELPGVCAHFVIDRDGAIYQLVSLRVMCRHTVGLNYTAIGIEHAGFNAGQVLTNSAEMRSSLALTRWLRCRYAIPMKDVIGHNESLASPHHRENVARLKSQTHGDWTQAEMEQYRARLRRLSC